ncbi:LysR family transcriptional regulator [Flindersiella endophytica]
MELYQLRSFAAVAEDLHMGRAAARLHLAQPTLSRQIASLERDLGVELFSRAHRRIQLTTAGEVLLAHAHEILSRSDTARRDARRAAQGELGTLRLGFVQSATYDLLPRLVRRFRTAFPDVHVEATFMTTLQQIAALRNGQLDAGLLRPRQPADATGTAGIAGLELLSLAHDPMVAVVPAGHRLAGRSEISLAALAGEPFVLYTKESGSTGYDLILDSCRQAGFTPNVVQHAMDAPTIVAMVAAGLGVSVLISPAPPIDPALVSYRRLSDPLPTWEMALAWMPGNASAALARFRRLATDAAGQRP